MSYTAAGNSDSASTGTTWFVVIVVFGILTYFALVSKKSWKNNLRTAVEVTLEENQITTITFENEKIKGYIQVTKTSGEDNKYSELEKGSPLPDVTFEVYDIEDNLVDTITTDENGKAITKELLKGCYKIKEKSL